MNADWKEVARAMREEGLLQREIADRLARPIGQVRRALMSDEQKERVYAGFRAMYASNRHGSDVGTPESLFTERHVPRTIRKLPGNPQDVARRFAAGEIDRAQLSRELRGEA